MAQIGISGNLQEWYGLNPTFNQVTVLPTGRNLKTWWDFDDFIGSFTTTAQLRGVWVSYYAGAGSSVGSNTGTTLKPGQLLFSTGTTNVGLASIISNYVFAQSSFAFGAGVFTFETDFYLPLLSTATEEFAVRIGWNDAIGAAVDGCYFEYDRTVGVNWNAVTANNSARTVTDTGVAVDAAAWIRLKIVVNADATAVAFYIDGVLVATNVLNTPSGDARNTSLNCHILKSVGATARTFLLDWTWLHYDLTATR